MVPEPKKMILSRNDDDEKSRKRAEDGDYMPRKSKRQQENGYVSGKGQVKRMVKVFEDKIKDAENEKERKKPPKKRKESLETKDEKTNKKSNKPTVPPKPLTKKISSRANREFIDRDKQELGVTTDDIIRMEDWLKEEETPRDSDEKTNKKSNKPPVPPKPTIKKYRPNRDFRDLDENAPNASKKGNVKRIAKMFDERNEGKQQTKKTKNLPEEETRVSKIDSENIDKRPNNKPPRPPKPPTPPRTSSLPNKETQEKREERVDSVNKPSRPPKPPTPPRTSSLPNKENQEKGEERTDSVNKPSRPPKPPTPPRTSSLPNRENQEKGEERANPEDLKRAKDMLKEGMMISKIKNERSDKKFDSANYSSDPMDYNEKNPLEAKESDIRFHKTNIERDFRDIQKDLNKEMPKVAVGDFKDPLIRVSLEEEGERPEGIGKKALNMVLGKMNFFSKEDSSVHRDNESDSLDYTKSSPKDTEMGITKERDVFPHDVGSEQSSMDDFKKNVSTKEMPINKTSGAKEQSEKSVFSKLMDGLGKVFAGRAKKAAHNDDRKNSSKQDSIELKEFNKENSHAAKTKHNQSAVDRVVSSKTRDSGHDL